MPAAKRVDGRENRWFLDGRHADGEEPDGLIDMNELEEVLDRLSASRRRVSSEVIAVIYSSDFDGVLDIAKEPLDDIGGGHGIR